MKVFEALVAVLLLAVVVSFATQLSSFGLVTQTGQYSAAQLIPSIFLAACAMLLCAVLIQIPFKSKDGGEQDLRAMLSVIRKRRRMTILIAACLYVLLLYPLGFVISSILFVFGSACLISVDTRRGWWVCALIAVIATVGIYAVVSFGLESYLPDFRGFAV